MTDAGEELRREAPSLEAGREDAMEEVEVERREAELTVRGALPRLAALPITGGEVGFEEGAGDDFVAGLSHEEKKSSSPPCDTGVAATSAPSTKILSGNLGVCSYRNARAKRNDHSLGGILPDTSCKLFLI